MRKHIIPILLLCLLVPCTLVFAQNQTLKIGYWDQQSETSQKFVKDHPEIEITSGNMNARTTEDLIGLFLTQEFTYDVFPLFSVQYNISPLMEKGYLADLSGNAAIQ